MSEDAPSLPGARHTSSPDPRSGPGRAATTADTTPGNPARPQEKTLAEQVRGILGEVLDGPGLTDGAKARLRRLAHHHEAHPEKALLEHLRSLRNADGSEETLLVG